MTSMLYTGCMMNTKPNVPGEIFMGEKDYSCRTDWRVNGWLFVAAIISALADIMFPHIVRHWPQAARVGIVLAEFLAIALWAQSLTRWIRGMDELHRRITTSAVLFSVGATFFFLMFWRRLDSAGLFNSLFGVPKGGGSWDICTVGHGFLLLTLFYFAGFSRFNRRFK
jgi:hypothetical protein